MNIEAIRTARKRNKAEIKREQFLSAAMSCLTRLGFNKCTMEDIAVEAGVKRVTIYREFGNRESLIGALIAFRLQALNDRFALDAKEYPDILSTLEAYLLASAGSVRENQVAHELARGPMNFTASGSPLHVITKALWQPWLEEAKNSGELVETMDLDAATEWILILLATLNRLVLDTEMSESHMRSLIRSFILPAFRAKPISQ